MQQTEYRNSIHSTNGTTEEIEFGVDVNEVIFKMLSSDVYNDPTLAVMREWSTNACDACIEAGLPVNYDVHIPTVGEPTFYVRDYGTGLSPGTVRTLFTKLGSSTKRESSITNGCLGIGRMAGLAVAEAFTVESYYNGTLYPFVVSMRNGIPVIVPLPESDTDKPNGLKLSVSVPFDDINNYSGRVEKLYRYFTYKPNLNVEADIYLGTGEEDWFVDKTIEDGNYVLMSQVMYKIPKSDELNTHGFSRIVVKAPPNSVTFNPGRESLSLNKKTIDYLQSMFEEVKIDFMCKVLSAYRECTTDADLMRKYGFYCSSSPYDLQSSICPHKYLSDYGKSLYHATTSIKISTKFHELTDGKVLMAHKSSYYSTFNPLTDTTAAYHIFYHGKVVLMDKKRCSRKKISSHYTYEAVTLWYRPKGVDFDEYLKEAKKVLSTLGIKYELYSDLFPEEEKEKDVKSPREGFFASPISSSVSKSEYMPEEEVKDSNWLYVKLSGYKPQLSGTTSFEDLCTIYKYLSKVTDVPKVRGVSKKYQSFVDDMDNWVDYETFIWDKLKDVTFITDMEISYDDITTYMKNIPDGFPEDIEKAHTEIEKYNKFTHSDNFVHACLAPDVKEFKERLVPYKPEDVSFYKNLETYYPLTLKVLTGKVNVWSSTASHALEVALLEERCNAIHTTS